MESNQKIYAPHVTSPDEYLFVQTSAWYDKEDFQQYKVENVNPFNPFKGEKVVDPTYSREQEQDNANCLAFFGILECIFVDPTTQGRISTRSTGYLSTTKGGYAQIVGGGSCAQILGHPNLIAKSYRFY